MSNSAKFISNTNETHKNFLLGLFEKADEVVFASGFLTVSGVENIKPVLQRLCGQKNKKATFYIGIGSGETDPLALIALSNIIKVKPHHKLVLCTPCAGIFHSKIYCFRTNEDITIVLGSANLTQSGWVTNDEFSTIIKTTVNSTDYKDLINYFNDLDHKYFDPNVSELINKYQSKLENYRRQNPKRQRFKFQRENTALDEVDLPKLKEYFEKYKLEKKPLFIDPVEREQQYREAKENLDALATPGPMTKQQFHDLFGPLVGHLPYERKLWHSGSIHRKTHKTVEQAVYRNTFRLLVAEIKSNLKKPAGVAFRDSLNYLKKMKEDKKITGIGVNILSEILMTFNAKKFANLNKNPLFVLNLIGKKLPAASTFKDTTYREYVELLKKVKDELGMNTFLEIDSFFNYVYWIEIEEYTH